MITTNEHDKIEKIAKIRNEATQKAIDSIDSKLHLLCYHDLIKISTMIDEIIEADESISTIDPSNIKATP